MDIFIDTGPLLARYLARDQQHAAAAAGFSALERRRSSLFTSNFVLDEAVTLLARRAGAQFAAARARTWYASAVLRILRPDPDDELRALDWLEKLADQAVSFTDCVSFALMHREKLRRAFTFDRHFADAGFEVAKLF
jgi:predicted nucleic acid-binding protein